MNPHHKRWALALYNRVKGKTHLYPVPIREFIDAHVNEQEQEVLDAHWDAEEAGGRR